MSKWFFQKLSFMIFWVLSVFCNSSSWSVIFDLEADPYEVVGIGSAPISLEVCCSDGNIYSRVLDYPNGEGHHWLFDLPDVSEDDFVSYILIRPQFSDIIPPLFENVETQKNGVTRKLKAKEVRKLRLSDSRLNPC